MFRSWYYFRVGYGTYITFPIGYVTTLVTIYYLAIRNVPGLLDVFSRFLVFGVVATAIGFPLSVVIGWAHMKRTEAWKSEVEVGYEAHPYNYKLPPGYNVEVTYPLFKELLTASKDILDEQGLLDDTRSRRIEELIQKLDLLLQGGYVGRPRIKL